MDKLNWTYVQDLFAIDKEKKICQAVCVAVAAHLIGQLTIFEKSIAIKIVSGS